MKKEKTIYICQSCGHTEPKWTGQCRECLEWNSLAEESLNIGRALKDKSNQTNTPKKIHEIISRCKDRALTGINEFDRVVGGGLIEGSLLLVGGEPGVGKSTLLMKVCSGLCSQSKENKTLYVSGEESESQVAARSLRLGINDDNFRILNETDWDQIKEQVKKIRPKYLVIDSIQTTICSDVQSAAGTITQIKEVTQQVMSFCKAEAVTTFLVGHVTKGGGIAGPKLLEHMVDAVIYFEGDQHGVYRILRAVKNRFGNTKEIGIFEMNEKGLEEVPNPSQYFLESIDESSFGRALSCIVEGARTIFVEIQALVLENKGGVGRRIAQGVDSNRLCMLVAIIEKYYEVSLASNDIYINIVGGIKLKSTEIDLAIIMAILSSLQESALSGDCIYIGELSLTGGVRGVTKFDIRLSEAERLNYKNIVTSTKLAEEYNSKSNLRIKGVANIGEINLNY